MPDPRLSPHPIRRIMGKVLLHGIPMPDAILGEIDDILTNVKELEAHSAHVFKKIEPLRKWMDRGVETNNSWVVFTASRKIEALLDLVRSNNRYMKIGNDRVDELFKEYWAKTGSPLL